MKNDVVVGKKSLRFYYFRYKDSPYYSIGVISLIVIICFVLISQVIAPQLNKWFSLREEVIIVRQKIATIRENINYMNNIDKALLDRQLQISASAIPPEKDFGQVMAAISSSALNSGVALQDYSFQVGSLASGSAATSRLNENNLVSITLTVSLIGDLGRVQQFIASMQQKLPLSQVVNINGSDNTISVDIEFYYKKLPNIRFEDDKKIAPISDSEQNLINSISGWQVPQSVINSGVNNTNPPLF